MSETNNAVRWPGLARDPLGVDFKPPITHLLQGCDLLGDSTENQKNSSSSWGPFAGTPPSFQIIESGATALAKVWATVAAAVGGSVAIGTAITAFWTSQDAVVRVAALIGLAVVLAAALVAIAIIVRGDIAARGVGAAAQYQARAFITEAFLRTSLRSQPWRPGELDTLLTDAMADFQARVGSTREWSPVLGVRMHAALGPEVQLKDGAATTWVPFNACEISTH